MDASAIIALAGLGLVIVGAITAAMLRFGKVEAAAEVARQAQIKADFVEATLAEFKERVARDYATAAMVAAVESRVVSAIDRLADRLDRILEMRPPPPTTRRSLPKG